MALFFCDEDSSTPAEYFYIAFVGWEMFNNPRSKIGFAPWIRKHRLSHETLFSLYHYNISTSERSKEIGLDPTNQNREDCRLKWVLLYSSTILNYVRPIWDTT